MSIKSWVNGSAIATIVGLNSLLTLSPTLAQSTNRAPDPQNSYPEEVVSSFVNRCVESALSQGVPEGVDPEIFPTLMQGMCSCMMWQFQDRYTLTQFESLIQKIQGGDQAASRPIGEVIGACIPQ